MNNELRAGRFTSSQVYRLMGSPAVRKTYINEVRTEIKLGKSLNKEFWSKATSWGSLMEVLAFNAMSMDWSLCSKETVVHKTLGKYYSGTPDVKKIDTLGEIKGYEYKNFCNMTDVILSKNLVDLKALNKGKEYWQTVSNAVLMDMKKGAVISYMPFERDFEIVKLFIEKLDVSIDSQRELHEDCGWVVFKQEKDVCLLPNDGYYKDLNIFEFDIPQEDLDRVTSVIEYNSTYLEDLTLTIEK